MKGKLRERERDELVPAEDRPTPTSRFVREASAFAWEVVHDLETLARRRWPVLGRTWGIDWLTHDWSRQGRRSRACDDTRGRGIRLDMVSGTQAQSVFPEYCHYREDVEIGDLPCPTWRDRLRVLTAHELAHVIQDSLLRDHGNREMKRDHGPGFQRVYRELRTRYVNPRTKPGKLTR